MSQTAADKERSNDEWTVWKRRVLLGFITLSVLFGLAVAIVPKGSSTYTVVQVVASLVLVILYLLWCFADSLEGDYPVGSLLMWLLLLMPYVGIPAYVIRGRGFMKGGALLGKMFGFFLLMAILFGITKGAVVYLLSALSLQTTGFASG